MILINKKKHAAPKSGQCVMPGPRKGHIYTYTKEVAASSARRGDVDDATWDKIVMGLMEEYDEAWTELADK